MRTGKPAALTDHGQHVGVDVADGEAVDVEDLERVVAVLAPEHFLRRAVVEDAQVAVDHHLPEGDGQVLPALAGEARTADEVLQCGEVRHVLGNDPGRVAHGYPSC